MNIKGRLEAIEKSISPEGVPEKEKLQIIHGRSINGEFIPNDPHDTVETKEAKLKEKYGTADGVLFIKLIDKFEVA
jgi:hypothetical protein